MNSLPSNWDSRLSRRGWLKGAAVAAAALAVPGAVAAALPRQQGAPRRLWFEHEEPDTYVAHAYELEPDGTLWLEYDDGFFHRFCADEFTMDSDGEGRWLWLRETAHHMYGYHCLTESEAQEVLDIA